MEEALIGGSATNRIEICEMIVNSSCTNSIFEAFFVLRVLLFVLCDEDEGKEYKVRVPIVLQSVGRIDDRCSDVISSLLYALDVLDMG